MMRFIVNVEGHVDVEFSMNRKISFIGVLFLGRSLDKCLFTVVHCKLLPNDRPNYGA